MAATGKTCPLESLLEAVYRVGIHHGRTAERMLMDNTLPRDHLRGTLFMADHTARVVFLQECKEIPISSLTAAMFAYDVRMRLQLESPSDPTQSPRTRFLCGHRSDSPAATVSVILRNYYFIQFWSQK